MMEVGKGGGFENVVGCYEIGNRAGEYVMVLDWGVLLPPGEL